MSIVQFQFQDHEVRTVTIDGEPWFVANDVCAVLGLANVGNVLARLDDDERGSIRLTDGTPGTPNRAIVSEPGLFDIIVRSDSPLAKPMRRWVTHEVLPAIRRTGSYAAPSLSDDEIIHRALTLSVAKIERLEAKIAEDAPKVEYVDWHVAPAGDVFTFRDAAAHLGVGEKALRAALVDGGWIYRFEVGREWSESEQQIVPRFEWRAKSAHAGKFSLRAQHNAPRYHNGQVRQTLYVFAGGLDAIRRKLARAGVPPSLGHALAVAFRDALVREDREP